MADAGTAANPLIDAGTQIGTPVGTLGYGARENADDTRQAQHMEANDAPVDVNMNAVVAREQALTFTTSGQMFQSNNDIRQKLQDRLLLKPTT